MPHPWLQGISQALRTVPSQCAICHAWPAQRLCDDCVRRFARQRPRCSTCALAVPEGVAHCGACLRHPNGLDACHAAVDYGYPWSGVLQAFKFRGDPGWAGALATLLRSTPWVEPALEAAELVLPIPLAPQRLRMRGFNQAQLLAQAMPPVQPSVTMPQSAVSYRVPVPVVQATATPVQAVYPTVVYRTQRVAQTVPWQLALLINGIRLTRRVKKVCAREMKDTKQEMRRLQRQLLRALARQMGLFAPLAGKRRVLPAHRSIRGATAQRFARR